MKKAFFIAVLIALILVAGKNIAKLEIILTTDSPYPYMVNNLDEQMECALKAGFVFKKPTLRLMRKPYVVKDNWGGTFYPSGYALPYLNIVILAGYASYETMAHELGHIIDYQTVRKGHPFFVGKEYMHYQDFANAVGDVILIECGKK